MSKPETTHLCPQCNCVEMEFVERIESNKHFRMRRFKCPVCDHQEMYTCGGPDDAERAYNKRKAVKAEKWYLKVKGIDLIE